MKFKVETGSPDQLKFSVDHLLKLRANYLDESRQRLDVALSPKESVIDLTETRSNQLEKQFSIRHKFDDFGAAGSKKVDLKLLISPYISRKFTFFTQNVNQKNG
jgi:hypothetical protein